MIITLVLLVILIGLVFFFRTYTLESFQNNPYMLNSIDMSNCSPGCCPSTYSCDSGCVCLSSKDKHFIAKRGNNTRYNGNLVIP